MSQSLYSSKGFQELPWMVPVEEWPKQHDDLSSLLKALRTFEATIPTSEYAAMKGFKHITGLSEAPFYGQLAQGVSWLMAYRLVDVVTYHRICASDEKRLRVILQGERARTFELGSIQISNSDNWPSLISAAHSSFKGVPRDEQPHNIQSPEPTTTLVSTQSENILLNFSLAALHMRILLNGHADIPDKQDLFTALAQNSRYSPGLAEANRQPDHWRVILNMNPASLKAPLHLSLAVSPIFLFSPLPITTYSINRGQIFKTWVSFGCARPNDILQVEERIWNLLIDLAQHVYTTAQIKSFIATLLDSITFSTDSPTSYNWFTTQLVVRPPLSLVPAASVIPVISSQQPPSGYPKTTTTQLGVQHSPPGNNMLVPSNSREPAAQTAEPPSPPSPRPTAQQDVLLSTPRQTPPTQHNDDGETTSPTQVRLPTPEQDLIMSPPQHRPGYQTPPPDEDCGSNVLTPLRDRGRKRRRQQSDLTSPSSQIRSPTPTAPNLQPSSQAEQPAVSPNQGNRNDQAVVRELRKRKGVSNPPAGEPKPKKSKARGSLSLPQRDPQRNRLARYETESIRQAPQIQDDSGAPSQPFFMKGDIKLIIKVEPDNSEDVERIISMLAKDNAATSAVHTLTSAVHTLTRAEFTKAKHELMNIFRHKHIVIHNQYPVDYEFDAYGMETLVRPGSKIRIDDQSTGCVGVGLSSDFVASHAGESSILYSSDFPMADGQSPSIYISTDAYASTNREARYPRSYPVEAMRWGLCGTQWAYHSLSVEPDGMALRLHVVCGQLILFIPRALPPAHENPTASSPPSESPSFLFSPKDLIDLSNWDFTRGLPKRPSFEAVLLPAGSEIYLQPLTPYFLLTASSTICHASYLVSAGTIQRTVAGMYNSFVVQHPTNHTFSKPEFHYAIRLTLWHWYQYLVASPSPSMHIPDLTKMEGVVDLFSLINLAELTTLIYRPTYLDLSSNTFETCLGFIEARRVARLILKWFNASYRIHCTNYITNAERPHRVQDIFEHFLGCQAHAIHSGLQLSPDCDVEDLPFQFMSHLEVQFPDNEIFWEPFGRGEGLWSYDFPHPLDKMRVEPILNPTFDLNHFISTIDGNTPLDTPWAEALGINLALLHPRSSTQS
ncbi:hypothetical protein BDN72DRAFT_863623 [Pluteus cervinus]|uniref:Uncharacterized protein n=1 Tax=Pluteus cervinus TaxID=181527 RepID=A0ACD3A7N2_9AGAR|nr:hypothetical protein BDN72DRAFT_863623 [Pluteus cervinus]